MKLFIPLVVAVMALALVQSASIKLSDDLKKMFVDSLTVCKAETPDLETETVANLKNHETLMIESEASKKFILCLHRQIGLQNDDGSYNVAKMKEIAFAVTGSHDYDSVIDECTKEDYHDAIENAWMYATCSQPKLPRIDLD